MESLKDRYRQASAQYQLLKQQIEREILRWEYATGRRYHPTPFYFEKHGYARGKLAKEPANFAYGFDSEDRIVVERQFVSGPEKFDEVFFVYLPESVESTQFDASPRKQVLNLSRQIFENGVLSHYEEYSEAFHSSHIEKFTWCDGTLVQSEHSPQRQRPMLYSYYYDDAGQLERIDRADKCYPNKPEICYRRTKKGENPNETLAAVRRMLVEQIPLVIQRAGFLEPMCCLGLQYDGGEPTAPPLLALTLESERKSGAHPSDIWMCDDWSHYEDGTMEFTDPKLLDACRVLNSQLAGKIRPFRKLFNDVAAELNALSWKEKLPVTDDFIVFAVDYEGVDLKANLRTGVPPERLGAWKRYLKTA